MKPKARSCYECLSKIESLHNIKMDGKGGPYYPFNAIKLVLFVSPTSDSKEVKIRASQKGMEEQLSGKDNF